MIKFSKNKLIKSVVLLAVVCIIILAGKFFTGQNSAELISDDFVAVLDVGQADSILICSNGSAALLDAGREMDARDIFVQLSSYGVDKLDALMFSHSHDDHTGGAEYIATKMGVDNIIIPDFRDDEDIENVNSAIEKSGAKVFTATEGMVINIGDFEITVLYADNTSEDINDRSVVYMAEINSKKFLFTGDAEIETEKALIDNNIDFDCDVLKVGHHGSSTSTSNEFLDIATPSFAAISVGANNKYSHPSINVINKLENSGVEVLRTDKTGDIVFFYKNNSIVLE